jgi:hypothetical protein
MALVGVGVDQTRGALAKFVYDPSEKNQHKEVPGMTSCAGASDHFGAWMTLLGAGIALFTALTVAGLSAFFEGRRAASRRAHEVQVEETKRQHEAAVRFHDDRLNAYIEYISATSALFANAGVWLENGAKGSFNDYVGDRNALVPYTKAFTRVSMLAKPELVSKLRDLHAQVNRLTDNLAPDVMRQIVTDSLKARAAFETAAKKEVGIG